MSASDPGPRRVCVHADGADVDLVLPATLPVAALIPAIVDMLGGTAAAAASYRLSPLGCAPLLNSTTLAQNGIGDGAVLVLSRKTQEPPTPHCGDQAQAVSAVLDNSTQSRPSSRITGAVAAVCLTAVGSLVLARDAFSLMRHGDATAAVAGAAGATALISAAIAHRVYRDPIAGLALSIIATTFAAVAGLLAVPGAPGAPHLLLAAMAAAATAVLAIRVTRCGAVTLTAVACCAVVAAGAALAGVVTAAPPLVVGSSTALVCLGLLEVAPRMSIAAGPVVTQPRPGPRGCGADRGGIGRQSVSRRPLVDEFACGPRGVGRRRCHGRRAHRPSRHRPGRRHRWPTAVTCPAGQEESTDVCHHRNRHDRNGIRDSGRPACRSTDRGLPR